MESSHLKSVDNSDLGSKICRSRTSTFARCRVGKRTSQNHKGGKSETRAFFEKIRQYTVKERLDQNLVVQPPQETRTFFENLSL